MEKAVTYTDKTGAFQARFISMESEAETIAHAEGVNVDYCVETGEIIDGYRELATLFIVEPNGNKRTLKGNPYTPAIQFNLFKN